MTIRSPRLKAAACALVAVLSVPLAGHALRADRAARTVPAADRIVVLISLDGFPARAWDDPTVGVPTLRRLAAEGATAAGLLPANPTVTWPNHTTFVTGVHASRHGLLFNGLVVREGPGRPLRIEPWRDKAELVRAPTVYDAAHAAGLTTAQVDWVAVQNADTMTWAFAERPDPEGPIEREMAAAGSITAEELAAFARTPIVWRDRHWTNAAAHIVRQHRPNLLLFHLLTLDSTHHRYGPGALAAHVAMAYVDDRVGQLLEALGDAGLRERATILIVSDHGFKAVTRSVRPNALLRQEGLLRVDGDRVACDAFVLSAGGTAMVYVTDPAKRQALVPRLRRILGSLEGIDRVVDPSDYPAMGLPTPDENDQAGDLLLVAADGYAFSGAHDGNLVVDVAGGTTGAHGYPAHDPEMRALFLASGYGIRRGARLDVVDGRDIAPTIAALLGLELPAADGRPLTAILDERIGRD